MPSEPAPFRRTDIASDLVARRRSRLVRQLGFKIAIGQPVPPLDTGEDLEAFDRPRHLGAFRPAQQRLVIEGILFADNGAMQMPITVAVPAHVIDQRLLKPFGLIGPAEQRLRKFLNGLWRNAWFRSGLGSFGGRGCRGTRPSRHCFYRAGRSLRLSLGSLNCRMVILLRSLLTQPPYDGLKAST